nr:MAG TPA: hypothetical protein [Caudoviricetes sp.]
MFFLILSLCKRFIFISPESLISFSYLLFLFHFDSI